MLDLATATLETFKPHVGTPFALDHPEHDETFTLVAAEPMTNHDHPLKLRDPFSLFFKGASSEVQFHQQILPLRHAALGEIQMFIVPIARGEDGTIQYQAVFN